MPIVRYPAKSKEACGANSTIHRGERLCPSCRLLLCTVRLILLLLDPWPAECACRNTSAWSSVVRANVRCGRSWRRTRIGIPTGVGQMYAARYSAFAKLERLELGLLVLPWVESRAVLDL